ncbi:MAG TPA: hypothetical protein VEX88_00135 [Glaciibacter sp.]|nr:hypothetical protein [Glaciibacter sp.]
MRPAERPAERASTDPAEAVVLLERQRDRLADEKGSATPPQTRERRAEAEQARSAKTARDVVALNKQTIEAMADVADVAEIDTLIANLKRSLRRGSLARTYRYLRIAMIATVIAIFLGIGWVWFNGFPSLPSISHYYFTPARIIFAGALVAATAALLALSGNGGQRSWLDFAAFFAPLIAIVPTRIGNGQVPGLTSVCAEGTECIPDEAVAYIEVGLFCWSIFVLGILAFAVVRSFRDREIFELEYRKKLPVSQVLMTWLPIVACGAIFVFFTLSWFSDRERFLGWAHFVSASTFFLIITVVALNQVRRENISSWREAMSSDSRLLAVIRREASWIPKVFTTLRGLIAALMLADIGFATYILMTGFSWDGIFKPVFLVEAVALVLFAAFWLIETQRKWNEPDPD